MGEEEKEHPRVQQAEAGKVRRPVAQAGLLLLFTEFESLHLASNWLTCKVGGRRGLFSLPLAMEIVMTSSLQALCDSLSPHLSLPSSVAGPGPQIFRDVVLTSTSRVTTGALKAVVASTPFSALTIHYNLIQVTAPSKPATLLAPHHLQVHFTNDGAKAWPVARRVRQSTTAATWPMSGEGTR